MKSWMNALAQGRFDSATGGSTRSGMCRWADRQTAASSDGGSVSIACRPSRIASQDATDTFGPPVRRCFLRTSRCAGRSNMRGRAQSRITRRRNRREVLRFDKRVSGATEAEQHEKCLRSAMRQRRSLQGLAGYPAHASESVRGSWRALTRNPQTHPSRLAPHQGKSCAVRWRRPYVDLQEIGRSPRRSVCWHTSDAASRRKESRFSGGRSTAESARLLI